MKLPSERAALRVLLWMIGGDIVPGGHRIQFEQTRESLRRLGVAAHYSFDPDPPINSYDLVHGFGLAPVSIRRLRQSDLPVVLSTIYRSKAYTTGQASESLGLKTMLRRARTGCSLFASALRGQHIQKCERILDQLTVTRTSYEMADLLLPNSESEAATIISDLSVTTPYHVTPNAVDPDIFNVTSDASVKGRRSVLYVGRFEPHKNQLGFIEAMRGSRIPVKLVGPPHPHHPEYYEKCKERATDNITILDGIPHEQLAPIYRAAKVHVLPSWFESPGLVSLEAGLCGCNIVTTNRGYTHDYFGEMAWYCDPADPKSIRRAVEAAYAAPWRPEVREHILSHFTWQHTANATLEGYMRVLSTRQPGNGAKT